MEINNGNVITLKLRGQRIYERRGFGGAACPNMSEEQKSADSKQTSILAMGRGRE